MKTGRSLGPTQTPPPSTQEAQESAPAQKAGQTQQTAATRQEILNDLATRMELSGLELGAHPEGLGPIVDQALADLGRQGYGDSGVNSMQLRMPDAKSVKTETGMVEAAFVRAGLPPAAAKDLVGHLTTILNSYQD